MLLYNYRTTQIIFSFIYLWGCLIACLKTATKAFAKRLVHLPTGVFIAPYWRSNSIELLPYNIKGVTATPLRCYVSYGTHSYSGASKSSTNSRNQRIKIL